jgi:hypothetical protein
MPKSMAELDVAAIESTTERKRRWCLSTGETGASYPTDQTAKPTDVLGKP